MYVNKYVAFTAGVAHQLVTSRYALVILINDPKAGEYYGGAVSAPVFSSIMGYALRANAIPQDAESAENTTENYKTYCLYWQSQNQK